MKNLSITEIRLYLTILIMGIIVGNITIGLPVMLTTKNLSAGGLASVIGISFLGAVVLPAVGALSDNVKHRKLVITGLGVLQVIAMLIFYFTTSITTLKVAVFLASVSAQSMYVIFDSIVLVSSRENNYNYGFIRSGMSLGFGLSIISSLPFIYLFDTSVMILVTAVLALLTSILSLRIDDSVCDKSEVHYISEIKYMSKNKLFLLMFVVTILIFTVNSIKLSYQTSKLTDIAASPLLIAIVSFIIIIPEMIIMPKYDKWFGNWSFAKIFMISTAIFLVNIFVLGFTSSAWIILFIAPLHGLGSALYIPKYAFAFRALLSSKILSTAFLVRATISALLSFLLSVLLLERLYENYGSDQVMYALAVLLSFNIVFIIAFNYACKKKRIIL